MANTKAKKSSRKAANTPVPCGPGSTCGHSGCTGGSCGVRYVGPTSHPRDHHAQEAAHGARHVWSAAIVAGLAVVLTGTVAFTTVQAQENRDTPTMTMLHSLRRIEQRLDRMEPKLNWLVEHFRTEGDDSAMSAERAKCVASCKGSSGTSEADLKACVTTKCTEENPKPKPTASTCTAKCAEDGSACLRSSNAAREQCAATCKGTEGSETPEADVAECKRACEATWKTAQSSCESTRNTCKASCATAAGTTTQ